MPDQTFGIRCRGIYCMVAYSVMRSIDYLHDNSPMVAVVRRCFFDFQILNRRNSGDKRIG